VYVLSLARKGGHTERLWVGRDDYLVRRLEFRLSPDGMFGSPPPEAAPGASEGEPQESGDPGEEFGQALLGTMLQALKMEMSWTERYTDLRLNAGVPQDAFRFRPQPGDRRVDRLRDIPLPEREPTPMPELTLGALTGQVAPDFTLPNLAGEPVTLSQLRGKPVLLYFWDSLCIACLAQLPDIEALSEERAADGLQVVGLNVDRSLDTAKESVAQAGLTFPILWQSPDDPESVKVDLAYRPEELPRLLVIDAVGIVRADLVGYHDRAAIEAAVRQAG
jgi:peroxiredoxin